EGARPQGQTLPALRNADREDPPRPGRHVSLPALPAAAERADPLVRILAAEGSMPNTIIVTREEPIAVVQINRPEVRNALNDEVMGELVAATRRLDDDEAIRCIAITGDEKALCAG